MAAIHEQKATLVEIGCETLEVYGIGTLPFTTSLIPSSYYMEFRLENGSHFRISAHTEEELPEIELGATHWVRIGEKAS